METLSAYSAVDMPMIPRSNHARIASENNCKVMVHNWMQKNLLLCLTVLAVILGIALGFVARLFSYTTDIVVVVSFPGELLMRMLKMLILPLIISSMISGLAQLDAKSCGKMGSWALLYYISTTIFAAVLGIILVLAIKPGDPTIKLMIEFREDTREVSTLDALLDLIRNMFPENLLTACFQQVETVLKRKSKNITVAPMEYIDGEVTIANDSLVISYLERAQVYKDGTNVLGLIVFCIAFGIMAGKLGEFGLPMVHFFVILNEIIMRIVILIMWYSPFGIMSLIVGKLMAINDLAKTAEQLGFYMLTVVTGLALHACITLPFLYFIITHKNPFTFFKGMLQAWVTALGTASSAATLPVTFRCLEENNGIDKRVTRFVLPVGATVNMDGTALYEAVAAIFIAQMNGIYLSAGQVISVRLASMPLFWKYILQNITQLNGNSGKYWSCKRAKCWACNNDTGFDICWSADRRHLDDSCSGLAAVIEDRVRTSVNVLGDAYGAGIICHLCRNELGVSIERPRIEIQERCPSRRQSTVMISAPNTFQEIPRRKKGLKCCNSGSQHLQEDDSSETQM